MALTLLRKWFGRHNSRERVRRVTFRPVLEPLEERALFSASRPYLPELLGPVAPEARTVAAASPAEVRAVSRK